MLMVLGRTLLPLAMLLEAGAVCILVLGGLAFMFQARRLAIRCVTGGAVLAVLAAMAAKYLTAQPEVSVLDLGVALALIVAVVAYVAGWVRTAATIALG